MSEVHKKGQSITECKKCNAVVHSKCRKASAFKIVNDKYYCKNCCDSIVHVYNLFSLNGPSQPNRQNSNGGNSDRHYDIDIEQVFDELSDTSNIQSNAKASNLLLS